MFSFGYRVEIPRMALGAFFCISLTVSIFIRPSIFSLIYILILLLYPIIPPIKFRPIFYFLSFMIGLTLCIGQIAMNIHHSLSVNDELQLTATSKGCNSAIDRFLFDEFGFAWFACDSSIVLFKKLFADIIVLVSSLIAFFYCFTRYIPQNSQITTSIDASKRIRYPFLFFEIILRVLIFGIAIINPHSISVIFFLAITIYPILKVISPYSIDRHERCLFSQMRHFFLYIFYFSSSFYLILLFSSKLPLVIEVLQIENIFVRTFKTIFYSHLDDINETSTSFVILSLHFCLCILLYIKIYLINNQPKLFSLNRIIFTSSLPLHITLFFNQYSHSLATTITLFSSMYFKNYTTFLILCLSLIPFLIEIGPKLRLIQMLILTMISLTSLSLQFASNLMNSHSYFLGYDYPFFEQFGFYTSGFTPLIFFIKYTVFFFQILSLSSLFEENLKNFRRDQLLINNCVLCISIREETWLRDPNFVVQFFLNVFSLLSRPVICIYPLMRLYYDEANIHTLILISIFLLVSITQTYSAFSDLLQKGCFRIANFYMVFWILTCSFIQIFKSITIFEFNETQEYIFRLFDFNNDYTKFPNSSFGWLLITLLVHRFLLTYFNSMVVSNRMVIEIGQNTLRKPRSREFLSFLNFVLLASYHYFLKINTVLVINLRLIIAIICFMVSLVRPSILTVLPFLFASFYAISLNKNINNIISRILMGLSVIVVLIKISYMIEKVPNFVWRPFFNNCCDPEKSTIATGLTKTDSFSPVLAFLFVVFIFSFLNSLKKYYDPSYSHSPPTSVTGVKSCIIHLLINIIVYLGYELTILTGILAIMKHKDVLSLLSAFFLFLLMIFHPNTRDVTRERHKTFCNFLDFYRYCAIIIVVLRFILYMCSDFLICYIDNFVINKHIKNIITELFVQKTLISDVKKQTMFSLIHLFVIRFYTRSINKKRIFQLYGTFPAVDFTACRNILESVQYIVFGHFIYMAFIMSYFAAFYKIQFIHISYMVCCGLIIVLEQRILYSKKLSQIIKALIYVPFFILIIKLFAQLFLCLNPPTISCGHVLLSFLFDEICPNDKMLTFSCIFPDFLVLIVFLIQNRLYLTTAFNYIIVNRYLCHLESVNISSIVNSESISRRLDYEKKLNIKREKIKKSIEAIKRNIGIDCNVPSSRLKVEALYNVDHSVFENFYSHREGQDQIFDDYNTKDMDDYIEVIEHPSIVTPVSHIYDPHEESITQPSNLKKKFEWLFVLLKIITDAFDMFISYIQKINSKDRERHEKIRCIIENGKSFHHLELKNFIRTIRPDFEFNDNLRVEIDESSDRQRDSTTSLNRFSVFMFNFYEISKHFFVRNTDFMVFLAIVLNQIYSSSVLSMIVTLSYFIYASVVVPRPSPTYWHVISLYVLFTSFLRYVSSIFPLSRIFTCSITAGPISTSLGGVRNFLCVHRILGIDGYMYSSVPDLLLLIAIQLHLISLQYRGVITHVALDKQILPTVSSIGQSVKNRLRFFMKKYETAVCTLEPDYYIALFLTQLGQWLIIAFYWNSLIAPTIVKGDITKIIKGSVIPVNFSVLITLQSLFILFDRFINLNRMRSTKFIYTILLVLIIHPMVFFFIPKNTNQSLITNTPLCVLYLLYCLYFYLSFIPVRNGYNSTNVLPYAITKYHNYYSLALIYAIIYSPIIYEIDTVLRWFSSTTFLGIFQFIKIDQIFYNMHVCKTFRKISNESQEKCGEPFSFSTKLFVTIFSLFIFFVALLLPLWLYSTRITAIKSVLPSQIDLSISINGYYPLYESTVVKSNFQKFTTPSDIERLLEILAPKDMYYSRAVLLDYTEIGDIIYAEFSEPSYSAWTISNPARQLLIQNILNDINYTVFRQRYKLYRESVDLMNVFGNEKVEGSFILTASEMSRCHTDFQKELVAVLNNPGGSMLLDNFLPTTIRVEPFKPLYSFPNISKHDRKHVCAFYKSLVNGSKPNTDDWWELKTVESEKNLSNICKSNNIKLLPKKMGIVFFIDYLKSSIFDLYNPSRNVFAFYIILITSFSTFLKKFFLNTPHFIMFQEIPNPNYILNLCQYIYRARWSGDIELEEFFVSILFFIYRSPETLIRTTRLTQQTDH